MNLKIKIFTLLLFLTSIPSLDAQALKIKRVDVPHANSGANQGHANGGNGKEAIGVYASSNLVVAGWKHSDILKTDPGKPVVSLLTNPPGGLTYGSSSSGAWAKAEWESLSKLSMKRGETADVCQQYSTSWSKLQVDAILKNDQASAFAKFRNQTNAIYQIDKGDPNKTYTVRIEFWMQNALDSPILPKGFGKTGDDNLLTGTVFVIGDGGNNHDPDGGDPHASVTLSRYRRNVLDQRIVTEVDYNLPVEKEDGKHKPAVVGSMPIDDEMPWMKFSSEIVIKGNEKFRVLTGSKLPASLTKQGGPVGPGMAFDDVVDFATGTIEVRENSAEIFTYIFVYDSDVNN